MHSLQPCTLQSLGFPGDIRVLMMRCVDMIIRTRSIGENTRKITGDAIWKEETGEGWGVLTSAARRLVL